MKHTKASFILLSIIIPLLLTSCKYRDIEFKGIKDFKINTLSLKEVSGTLIADIANPNGYKFKVKAYDLLITVNNFDFRSADSNPGIVIPAKSDTSIYIPLKLSVESKLFSLKTLQSLSQTFAAKNAEITIKGDVKVKVMGFSKNFRVNEKTLVNLNKNH
jgi:LEA14-like dessication related protein